MKAWWQQLNVREQRLVLIMSGVISIFILYGLIWQPLNENIAKQKLKIERQQALLTWVEESTQRYQEAKRNGRASSGASLSSIVNRTSRANNIIITRMQPQGEDLQVWIDEISFNQLLTWLEKLASRDGLQVKNIDLSLADQQGVVRVRRLQLGKN
ncbi:type II secretion system protein GspM [Cognaticolwellia beringensis]|uniref:Type II secretion system protein M n=1 Tax=Cognaticolwellia beringensis TaxID=1967665 RepID=A0A222G963_9GAMM|nr:type II secretion system protein M [Cognaticolwellia beringensis]ASP48153.1 type II secretion system protein M [Cognaticolwellia beringensis]|tara:strand:- start:2166 stop:2633 length:468 start_codon:yes stop_codon:yes gene_type:complete